MNRYGKEINLKEQKGILINILKNIDEFCEENNIKYYLTGGTLLGAIRHNGFIPWDDDIDIAMFRDDYEKFVKLYKENEDFKLLHYSTEPQYYYQFSKVIAKKTILIEENLMPNMNLGAYIDVFPIDFGGNDIEKAYKINSVLLRPWKLLNTIKLMDEKKKRNIFKQSIVKTAKIITHPISWNFVVKKIDEVSQKYNNIKNSKYCGVFSVLTYGKKEIMETVWYKERIKHNFENELFYIPKEYEKILQHFYGDYMKMPPEDKRISHHNYKIYWKQS